MRRFLFLFPFFFFSFAQASIFVEPYIGGGVAYFDDFHSGFSFGSRLGYKKWGFISGIDISYAQFHLLNIGTKTPPKNCDNKSGKRGMDQISLLPCDEEIEQHPENLYGIFSIGPSVSFDLPFIIDVYTSLTWSWANKQMLNVQKTFNLSGPGARLGISYLQLPLLKLNLEVQGLMLSCNSLDSECQEQNTVTYPIIMGQFYISMPINTGVL